MAFSLFPGFVDLVYTTPYAPHVMRLPTRQWSAGGGGGGHGRFLSWNDELIDADTMITDFTELLAEFWTAATEFNSYTIYTMEDENAVPLPRTADQLSTVGTNASTYWGKAVQTTFSIRSEGFHQAKLVLLDAPAPSSFDKITSFGASPEALALVAAMADEDNAWSARDNTRPLLLTQISYTLNEALRREYNMV